MIDYSRLRQLSTRAALERFVQKQFQDDYEKLMGELNSTVNQLLSANLKQAGKFVDKLGRCAHFFPIKYRPRIRAMEARHAHWSGQSHLALKKYKAAIKQMEAGRDFAAAAQARQGLMDVYMYLGQHDHALATGRKALAYFRRAGKDQAAAKVMTNLGNIFHRLDQNRRALTCYEGARRIFEKNGGAPLATVDFNRANIYANLNQIERAEKLYRQAAEIYRQNGMSLLAGKAEYSLAYLLFLRGRYTEALTQFEKVQNVFRDLGDIRAAAVTQLDLAEIDIYLNQYGTAATSARTCIDSFRKLGLRYEQAKATYFAGEALGNLGDYLDASGFLRQAGNLFRLEGNQLWQGMIAMARCRLALASGHHITASRLAQNALRLFKQSGDERRYLDAEIAFMEAQLGSGQPSKAFQRGQELLGRRLLGYQKHNLNCLMGHCQLSKAHPRAALGYFRRAIKTVEKTLTGIYPDEVQFFFALGKYETYLAAVETLLQLGRVQESFLEHSRALAVLNQRHISRATLQSQIPRKYLDTQSQLRTSLKRLSLPPESGLRRVVSISTALNIEQKIWANEKRIRSALYATPEAFPSEAERDIPYSVWLGEGETLINFVEVGGHVGAFHIMAGETKFIPRLCASSDLSALTRELHFLMETAAYAPGSSARSSEIINSYLAKLHSKLLAPLKFDGKTRRLIFLVDGIFAQIPYPALRDAEGDWLKDRYELHLIVNPHDLRLRKEAPDTMTWAHNAVFAPQTNSLPLTQAEANKICSAFADAQIYCNGRATSTNLKSVLQHADGFVHVAAHASRSSENPLFSRILMSDGPLFPFDLFDLGIHARLVTLSGCQTAAPGIFYGNSFSLAKAFYQGGARHVLASLWPISDKASLVFMAAFYDALKETNDISAAYQTALNRTKDLNENAAFWSPFVLMGI